MIVQPFSNISSFLGEHDNQKNVADRLYALKQQNRNLKVLLSIGGYTASESGQFDTFILDPAKRAFSARTAVNLMASLGMDGLDWDYEYPKTPDQSSGLVDLLRLSRQELDAHAAASAPGYDFELTIASPAGWNEYSRLPMKAMDQYLSFWNLMAYDFAGASWSTTVQYHSNLYPASAALTATSVSGIVDAYIGLSIPADKIVLGLPLYGRTFQGSFGPGTAHSSARPLMPDQFEAGSYDLKVLPRPGTKEQFDQQAGSAWCYNPSTGETVTYDNAQSVAMKAQFIRDRGLGGAMWWEASGDRTGGDSLIGKMAAGLGLEQKTNTLARV